MALRAKRRTKSITKTISPPHLNGHRNGSNGRDGFYKREWVVGDPPQDHPLAGVAGSFKDDPLWDEFIQIMKDLRREELERDLKNLEGEL